MTFLMIYLAGVVISFFYSRYVIVTVCTRKHEDDIRIGEICTLASWIGVAFMVVVHVLVAEEPKWLIKWFYRE